MTQGDTKIAHTATAGDGGERTWHRDGALLYTLKPHVNQFGRSRGKMVNDVTVRVEGPDADTIATEIHAALAQAPAVQAPAGEDASLLEQAGSLLSSVESILDEMWNSHCKADAMTTLVTEASEDISALRKLLAASPTPTDAQPKAARPAGDEALREAARKALNYIENNESELGICLDCGDNLRAVLASHPTTGQETVATPRDGGVRQALEGLHGAIERLDPTDGIEIPSFSTPDELASALGLGEGLSAPGSAGPGEAPALLPKDETGALFMYESARQWLRNNAPHLLATPSPEQEPGTGDTGEAGRPIEEAPRDGTPIIAWGAPSSLYPDEREWRETRWTLYGEGSPAHAAHKAGKGPEGYWDWSEPHSDWGASWKPTRFIPLPTPATTAETRGPAEGAR